MAITPVNSAVSVNIPKELDDLFLGVQSDEELSDRLCGYLLECGRNAKRLFPRRAHFCAEVIDRPLTATDVKVQFVSALFNNKPDNIWKTLLNRASIENTQRLLAPLMNPNHSLNPVRLALQKGNFALKELITLLKGFFNNETLKVWLIDLNNVLKDKMVVTDRNIVELLLPMIPAPLLVDYFIVNVEIPIVIMNWLLGRLPPERLQQMIDHIDALGGKSWKNVMLFDSLWLYCVPHREKVWPFMRQCSHCRLEKIASSPFFPWKDYERTLINALAHLHNNNPDDANSLIRTAVEEGVPHDFWKKFFHWSSLIELLEISEMQQLVPDDIDFNIESYSFKQKGVMVLWFKPQYIRRFIKSCSKDEIEELIPQVQVDEGWMNFDHFLIHVKDNWLNDNHNESDKDTLSFLLCPILEQLAPANVAATAGKEELAIILVAISNHLNPSCFKALVPVLSLDLFHELVEGSESLREHLFILQCAVPKQVVYYLDRNFIFNSLASLLQKMRDSFHAIRATLDEKGVTPQTIQEHLFHGKALLTGYSKVIEEHKHDSEKIIAHCRTFKIDRELLVNLISNIFVENIESIKKECQETSNLLDAATKRLQLNNPSPQIPDDLIDTISGALMTDPVRLPIDQDGSGGQLIDRESALLIVRAAEDAGETPLNPFTRRPFAPDTLIEEDDLIAATRSRLASLQQ